MDMWTLTGQNDRWCLPEEFISEGFRNISEKEDDKLMVYMRKMNFSGRLTKSVSCKCLS